MDGRNEHELFGGPVSWVRWPANGERILFVCPAEKSEQPPGRYYDIGALQPGGGKPQWLSKNVRGRLSIGVYCRQANALVYPRKGSGGGMDLYVLDPPAGRAGN